MHGRTAEYAPSAPMTSRTGIVCDVPTDGASTTAPAGVMFTTLVLKRISTLATVQRSRHNGNTAGITSTSTGDTTHPLQQPRTCPWTATSGCGPAPAA